MPLYYSVCAATVYDEPALEEMKENKKSLKDGTGSSGEDHAKSRKWNEFVASIKSRLTVAQVVQSVKANAILTFDFLMLVLVAG